MNKLQDVLYHVKAYQANGFYSLAFAFMENWWLFLILLFSSVTVMIYLKDEMDLTVKSEQQVL